MDCLPIHHFILHRVPHHHVRVHQLQEVLVARNQYNRVTQSRKGSHHRGDNIIRLHSILLEHQDIRGFDKFSDIRDLELQIVGHGRPICLVCRVQFMPKNRSSAIEGDSDMLRLFLPHQTSHHVDKAEHRVSGRSLAVRKGHNSMICAINV
ncbi:MAG: hypothetical protein ACD_75C02531G0001 [uncultured bacterium]|nr:MAG: hypothetical protein ACD_75C02531G0001 [uncultured bacterium]